MPRIRKNLGNMPKKVIPVPQCARGCVIGKGGSTINMIRKKTGVRVQMNDDGAHLFGSSQDGIAWAEELILDIIAKRLRRHADSRTVISIPSGMGGYVIGRRGSRIQKLKRESGANIQVMDSGTEVTIEGTDEQRAKAEKLINEALQMAEEDPFQGATKIIVPKELVGAVIGTGGGNAKTIQDETGTEIKFKGGSFLIKGEDSQQVEKATLLVKRKAVYQRKLNETDREKSKVTYVDGSYISEDNSFMLERVDDNFYKLKLVEEPLSKESDKCLDERLRSYVLDVLNQVVKEKKEEANGDMIVDMWCHFGLAFLKGIDAEDEDDIFSLNQVREKFKVVDSASCSSSNLTLWGCEFPEGIDKLEVEKLEEHLSARPCNVPPNTRYDFSFLTPSCRQIRVKAFSPKNEDEARGIEFFDHAPVTMKNVLEHFETHDGKVNFYFCAPYSRWAKMDIIIPTRQFDCRLILRTSQAVVDKPPDQEEEIAILTAYLDENLICRGGKLELSHDSPLPEGFHLDYSRRCDRRSYPYSYLGEDYTVMISEETSEDKIRWEGTHRQKTDIHLHCDDWDKTLLEGNWEPQEIVSKLPAFLGFVRSVQENVFVPQQEIEED